MDRSRNRTHVRIVSEDTHQMSLPIFPYIPIDPQSDAGRNLLRTRGGLWLTQEFTQSRDGLHVNTGA